MTYVRINKGNIGLVFRYGDLVDVVKPGLHWIGWNDRVTSYNVYQPFTSPYKDEVLLEHPKFKAMVDIVEVRDNEIALRFENGYFKGVLKTGKYIFWKGFVDYEFKILDTSSTKVIQNEYINKIQDTVITSLVKMFHLEEYEKGLLFVDGHFMRTLPSGRYRFWKNKTPIELVKVDTRKQQMEVSGQEILTKDKASIRVSFFIHFQVKDVKKAILENKSYADQLYMLMQFALREFIGTLTLDELLEKKNEIGKYVMSKSEKKAEELGVELQNAGIRDIILPGDVKEIMNQVLVAQKRAQANIITRREETASTRSLLNTAKLMEDNAMLFKLKEMEYMEKIAEKIGEVTVKGDGSTLEQLTDIFISKKK